MYIQRLHGVCATSTTGLIEVQWGVSDPEYDCVWLWAFFLLKPHVYPGLNHLAKESSIPLLWVQIRLKVRSTVRAKPILLSFSSTV